MAELSPAAQAIRQAVQAVDAVFALSTTEPTTEDVVVAVLRAGAARLMDCGGDQECVDHLMRLADELEASHG